MMRQYACLAALSACQWVGMDNRMIARPESAGKGASDLPDHQFGGRRTTIFLCALLALAVVALYWPALKCGFINYDDPDYFEKNPHVQAGLTWAGVHWAFTTSAVSNWNPLTWLSFMLDVAVFGKGPVGPHLTQLLLHAADSVLLFLVLKQLTGAVWRSAAVAGLFALHPLHVESVAWIAERKDTLSTLFWLLTTSAYAAYAKPTASSVAGHDTSTRRWYYAAALGFFALGLMAKPMLVTLPFTFLLLDYWPLRRIQFPGTEPSDSSQIFKTWPMLLIEKTPFFALSAVSSLITLTVTKNTGAMESLKALTLGERVSNAFVAYARYLGKTFWPLNLALPYPHPGHWPPYDVVAAASLMAGLSIIVIWQAQSRPYLAFGWFWFLGTLVPVLGVVQWGIQSMADRYTYIPLIGIFVAFVWGVTEASARPGLTRIAAGVLVLLLTLCAVLTHRQLGFWQNSETLFRHTLAVTGGNEVAYENLADYLVEHGQVDEALTNYTRALDLNPASAIDHKNMGGLLLRCGHLEGGIRELETSLTLDPNFADAKADLAKARINFARELLSKGQLDAAISQYEQALELDPAFAERCGNVAWALATYPVEAVRNGPGALELAARANQVSGGADPLILRALAAAFAETGRFPEALAAAEHALEIARKAGDESRVLDVERQISAYRLGQPFRDATLTNASAAPSPR
jgi:Tfp pilus assembly protein PilF